MFCWGMLEVVATVDDGIKPWESHPKPLVSLVMFGGDILDNVSDQWRVDKSRRWSLGNVLKLYQREWCVDRVCIFSYRFYLIHSSLYVQNREFNMANLCRWRSPIWNSVQGYEEVWGPSGNPSSKFEQEIAVGEATPMNIWWKNIRVLQIRHVAVVHFLDHIGMRSIDLILIDFISMRYLIFDLKDQHQQVSIWWPSRIVTWLSTHNANLRERPSLKVWFVDKQCSSHQHWNCRTKSRKGLELWRFTNATLVYFLFRLHSI